MIGFLLKGLLRDRSRSLVPTITVAVGVFLTVFLFNWLSGAIEMIVHDTAVFSSGHVKIMTRAYAKDVDQLPNDLALTGAGALLDSVRREFPSMALQPGDTVTLIGSTMNGSLATVNFIVAGTVRFGIAALDHGAMIADLGDVRQALDMDDAAGEILGFFGDLIYRRKAAEEVAARFNASYAKVEGPYAPEMVEFREGSGLASFLDFAEYFSSILVFIFVGVMSIVLWNAGLMGSLRRYGEIGVRLAVGEAKGHVYRSMIAESAMIGVAGSVVGTALGLALSYWLQVKGINLGSMMQNASILIQQTIRARVTTTSFYLGFVPGLCATLLGTSLSGIGIYRRQTSQLAKEMES